MNSDLFVDGRKKENRVSKLGIDGVVGRSVMYVSGSTQGSEFAKSVVVIGNILIPLVGCYHH